MNRTHMKRPSTFIRMRDFFPPVNGVSCYMGLLSCGSLFISVTIPILLSLFTSNVFNLALSHRISAVQNQLSGKKDKKQNK